MKKSGLVLFSAALVGLALSAKAAPALVMEGDGSAVGDRTYLSGVYTSEDHGMTVCQLGIADPLQIPSNSFVVRGLRWNLFYGSSFAMHGLDIGLSAFTRTEMSGVALQAANWVEGDMTGLQIGLLGNVVGGTAIGAQFGGIISWNRGPVTGFEMSPVNLNGSFDGVQLGLLNMNKGAARGLELGIANINLSELSGCSIGLLNCADTFAGAQFGLVNIVARSGRGVQFGVFNAAESYEGLQIGLLNVIGNATIPVLPLVNGNF